MQAMIGRISVCLAKQFGRGLLLVAADADPDHVAITIADRQLENRAGCFRTELANCIEDPKHRDTEIALTSLAPSFQALENGCKILLAPQANAYGYVNLRMQNILRLKLLQQAVGDQFVVFASLQVIRHFLERHQKAGEV